MNELEFVCWMNSQRLLSRGHVLPLDLKGKTAQRLTPNELLEWRKAAAHFHIEAEVAQPAVKLKSGRQPKYVSNAARERARRAQNRKAAAQRRDRIRVANVATRETAPVSASC